MTAWKDIPGWSCSRVTDLYDEMAKVLKPSAVAVECGVAYGQSLAYLASVLDPGVDILAVDIWQTFQGRTTLDRKQFEAIRNTHHSPQDAARFNVGEVLNSAPNRPHRWNRIEWIPARSEDVPKYLDFDVDFVFLDDHHEYESVRDEIRAWLPRLKPSGVIAGHDCNDHYPGVLRAARELGSRLEVRPPAPGENGWGGVWLWRNQ